VQPGADGRLSVCGPQVALGYRDGRDRHRWSVESDGVRCFQTDDVGRVGADGLVIVGGRADDVVQVAGTSVSVGAVREALESDPRVIAAEVVTLPDERFGATVAAVVVPGVPAPGARELADLVEARLGRAARPRVIRLVREIPMLESGKPDRVAIADLARTSPL
jgi:O-succinylbenzoic acid--CoA ligase